MPRHKVKTAPSVKPACLPRRPRSDAEVLPECHERIAPNARVQGGDRRARTPRSPSVEHLCGFTAWASALSVRSWDSRFPGSATRSGPSRGMDRGTGQAGPLIACARRRRRTSFRERGSAPAHRGAFRLAGTRHGAERRAVTAAPDDAATDGGTEGRSASTWRAHLVSAGRVTDHTRSGHQARAWRSARRGDRGGRAHPAAHVLFRLRGCATADKSRPGER